MNTQRYVIGSIIVWVVLCLLEYLLHCVILAGSFESIKHILRPEDTMMLYLPATLLGNLIFSFAFCYIFIKGREGKGMVEGIRYGLLIGFGFGVSSALVQYSMYPLTGWIMTAHFFGLPILMAILGAFFANWYQPASQA